MKIEIFYVPDCPHVPVAMVTLREVLSQEAVTAEIVETIVPDIVTAEMVRMCGSPTIRVNGQRVFGEQGLEPSPTLSCRRGAGPDDTILTHLGGFNGAKLAQCVTHRSAADPPK